MGRAGAGAGAGLFHQGRKPNIPIALIEAKDNNQPVGAGMQQGLEYAATLDIPFVFSSNGDAFLFHDDSHAMRQTQASRRPGAP